MNPNDSFHPEDLPLYAMQLLPPEEGAMVRLHLEHNPASWQEVAEIQGVLAAVALATDMQAPSPATRTRFLKAIAQEKRLPSPVAAASPLQSAPAVPVTKGTEIPVGPPADEPSPAPYNRTGATVVEFPEQAPRRSLPARVLPWVGWAIAAGLALTTGNLYQKTEGLQRSYATNQSQLARTNADAATARDVLAAMTDEAAMRVTLTRQGALLTPTGRTVYSAEKGVLIFSATNIEPVQTFKVYELWLIPANGGKPMPAGTFRPDARGTATMVLTTLPKGIDAKAFGITLEDDGGAKTPTLPILMTGA